MDKSKYIIQDEYLPESPVIRRTRRTEIKRRNRRVLHLGLAYLVSSVACGYALLSNTSVFVETGFMWMWWILVLFAIALFLIGAGAVSVYCSQESNTELAESRE